jgi:hypothetical protein
MKVSYQDKRDIKMYKQKRGAVSAQNYAVGLLGATKVTKQIRHLVKRL